MHPISRTFLLAAATALLAQGASQAALIAHYQAEDNALDATGVNHGTLMAGADFAPGKIGQAFNFDGVDDYVSVPNHASLDVDAVTVAAWVRPESLGEIRTSIVWRGRSVELTTNNSFTFIWQGAAVVWQVGTGGNKITSLGSNELPLNQFTHIAGLYSGADYRLYVNGVLTAHVQNSDGPVGEVHPDIPMFIGASGILGAPHRYFDGQVDDLRIYNHALTPNEIAALVPEPTALALAACALMTHALRRRAI